jgi:putative membrane protein
MTSRFPRSTQRWRLSVAFALAAGSVSFSSLFATPPHAPRVVARNLMLGFTPDPLATDDLRVNEKAFLVKALETTRQQMRLAEVGASQAESSDVRSHALQLVADYRTLSDALDALIRRKGGIAEAPVGGTSEKYDKLMSKSGAEFDREFMRTVADRSYNVMTLFEQAAAESKDTDVRDFAAAELPVLRGHRNAAVDLKRALE